MLDSILNLIEENDGKAAPSDRNFIWAKSAAEDLRAQLGAEPRKKAATVAAVGTTYVVDGYKYSTYT